MKRNLCILLIAVLLVCFLPGLCGQGDIELDEQPQPQPQAVGTVVINQKTKDILYEKNAHQRLYPASTTKILTALLVIENEDLDITITVGDEIQLVDADGSRAGLKTGEQITIKDLLAGLMLRSGNDAAYVLAVHTARQISGNNSMNSSESVAYFAELMNRRARKVGARDSHFVNPDGYHDEQHYTTAYDMALIAREAMKKRSFREIVSKKSHLIHGNNGELRHCWKNTNRLLDPDSPYHYPAATGIKTGYTKPAGHCFVASADIEGKKIIAVIFNSSKEGKWTDSIQLLDYGAVKANNSKQKEYLLYIILVTVLLFLLNKRKKGRKKRKKTK